MTAWTESSVRVRVPRIALLFLLGCVSLAFLPSLLGAQTVSPQTVEFDPSADHNSTVGGVAVVSGYELRFYAVGGAPALQTIGLGKPSPEGDGKIRYNFASQLGAWPVDGTVYEARVAAVGPGGSTASTISNQFVFPSTTTPPPPPAPCSYVLSSTSRTAGAAQTTGTVGVTAGTGCAWTAASDAGWLGITSGSSGSGNGSVSYTVSANAGTSQRVGHLSIAGATFTLTQAGGTCTYTMSPTSRTAGSALTTGTVSVTAGTGCAWTAASDAGWLEVTSGSTGSGNGSVSYTAYANSGTAQRAGHLIIAGATFTLTQAGGACGYDLSSTSRTAGAAQTTGTVSVTAGSGCTWTAASDAGWLEVTSGSSGSGNGSVGYTAYANTGASVRVGHLTIGDETFTFIQNGTCVYTVTPTSESFNPVGQTDSVSVTAGSGCAWTATRSGSWITITSGASGSGNGTVGYRVSANTGSSSRTGTLTVAGQAVIITQSAATTPHAPAGLRIVTVR